MLDITSSMSHDSLQCDAYLYIHVQEWRNVLSLCQRPLDQCVLVGMVTTCVHTHISICIVGTTVWG